MFKAQILLKRMSKTFRLLGILLVFLNFGFSTHRLGKSGQHRQPAPATSIPQVSASQPDEGPADF